MTKKSIQEEIEKAKPVITELLSCNYSYEEAKIILLEQDMSVINTIKLLMIMGRDAQYNKRKKPYKHPIATIQSWVRYLNSYQGDVKENEIGYIIGKIHLKSYLLTAVKLLSI